MTTTNPTVATHHDAASTSVPSSPIIVDDTDLMPLPGIDPQSPALAAPSAAPSKLPRWLQLPMGVSWRRVRWSVTLTIALIHVLALLAFVPGLFSWSGLAVSLIGFYLFGTLGINICYHRLLTHRSFKTPKWFERVLTLLALCSLEGSPVSWVANHRMHHQHSDHEPDPHSPIVAFLWSHIGWLLVENRDVNSMECYTRYARDLWRDKFHNFLSRDYRWMIVPILHAAAIFGLGALVGWWIGGTGASALRMALSWLVWGVFVRIVLVWHITWSVNSLTHMAGYRNYETNENSRNNWFVAILSMGEGWHNNHHADQNSAAHGHKWWEIDLTYITILAFKRLGLAWNVVKPRKAHSH